MRTFLSTALLLAISAPAAHAARYTYHGDLLDGDAPAAGRYDIRVRALADADARRALGGATELPDVEVVDGRFSVEVDVPEDADGSTWIEVSLRRARSGDAYESLGAPQPLTAKVNSACPGAWALDGNTGVPAGSFLGIADPASGAALELRARNVAVARYVPGPGSGSNGGAPAIAIGASTNTATAVGSTVAGGGAVRDGSGNLCAGCPNQATAIFATVGGGIGNQANGEYSVVPGGFGNEAEGNLSTVLGGSLNRAAGVASTITGGGVNVTSGFRSAVLGGSGNCAGGDNSVALGTGATTRPGNEAGDVDCSGVSRSSDTDGDEGSFVWGDSQPTVISTLGPDQFLVRAQGGVGINAAPVNDSIELTVTSDADGNDFPNIWLKQKASNAGALLSAGNSTGAGNNSGFYIDHYTGSLQARRLALNPDGSVQIRSNVTEANTGVTMAANGGAWSSLSDRRLKTAIAAVDPLAILDRLVDTPITTWSYVAQGTAVRHIGPMAQDFAAAFEIGENDTTISTVDADGVALAAIQGLNAKLERENAGLRADNEVLRERLDALAERMERLESHAR